MNIIQCRRVLGENAPKCLKCNQKCSQCDSCYNLHLRNNYKEFSWYVCVGSKNEMGHISLVLHLVWSFWFKWSRLYGKEKYLFFPAGGLNCMDWTPYVLAVTQTAALPTPPVRLCAFTNWKMRKCFLGVFSKWSLLFCKPISDSVPFQNITATSIYITFI